MEYYTNTLDNGSSFSCSDDTYVIDAAQEQGINMPFSCRPAACSIQTLRRFSFWPDAWSVSVPLFLA